MISNGHISTTTIHLYSACRAVIFAIAQLSCTFSARRNTVIDKMILTSTSSDSSTVEQQLPRTKHGRPGFTDKMLLLALMQNDLSLLIANTGRPMIILAWFDVNRSTSDEDMRENRFFSRVY